MIILHSAETGETSTAAEGVARYFATGSGGRSASAHYTCDNNSTVQSVPELRLSWGVVGFNREAIHVEQAGVAKQTLVQWADAYSKTMIDQQVIPLLGDILRRRPTIAHQLLTVTMLVHAIRKRQTPSGMTTHANCTEASRITGMRQSGHTDPGPGYPTAAVFAAAVVRSLRP